VVISQWCITEKLPAGFHRSLDLLNAIIFLPLVGFIRLSVLCVPLLHLPMALLSEGQRQTSSEHLLKPACTR
jgi:hypothetical protein